MSVLRSSLQHRLQITASGVMKINWHAPFLTSSREVLSIPSPMYSQTSPFGEKVAFWSCISATRGRYAHNYGSVWWTPEQNVKHYWEYGVTELFTVSCRQGDKNIFACYDRPHDISLFTPYSGIAETSSSCGNGLCCMLIHIPVVFD